MSDAILRTAKREAKRLADELLVGPDAAKFREYMEANEIVWRFESRVRVHQPARLAEAARAAPAKQSEGARIEAAAKTLLQDLGKRASSGEIAKALINKGVQIGGDDKASRVSAYLSASKDFDNIRGKGYGLREWQNGEAH